MARSTKRLIATDTQERGKGQNPLRRCEDPINRGASGSLGVGSRECDSEPMGSATFKRLSPMSHAPVRHQIISLLGGRQSVSPSGPPASWINGRRPIRNRKRSRRGFSSSQLCFGEKPVIAVVTVFTSSLFVQVVRSTFDFAVARHCSFSRVMTPSDLCRGGFNGKRYDELTSSPDSLAAGCD